jgi:hypothetical protein
MNWVDLGKYFVHGIAFSLLFVVLVVVWVFVTAMLVAVGAIIGLLIGLGVLVLLIGALNAFITSRLWFSVKSSFWDLVGHGLVLIIVLLIVGFFITWIPSQIFPGLATQVYSFIVGSFVNGFVGKTVAGWFRSEWPEEVPASIEREWEDKRL